MTFLRPAVLAALFVFAPLAGPAAAQGQLLAERNGIRIEAGVARATGAMARTGVAYMQISNQTDQDDRLIEARSDAAERVELHTHLHEGGVAKMRSVEDGVPVPANEAVLLEQGGLHVMFMGLTVPWEDGATVPVTLVFETAGEIDVALPVDLPAAGGGDHGAMHGHGG